MLAKVAATNGMFEGITDVLPSMDSEMGLPILLATFIMGLMLSSYFSAILSTADSCLMASGNIVTDILAKF
jgi:SSS family solute:Na+ symporter